MQKLRSMVHEIVGRINGHYGTLTHVPIHHLDRQLSFHELCALYAITDVALVTSLRDGMNLVSYEYVACQSDNAGGTPDMGSLACTNCCSNAVAAQYDCCCMSLNQVSNVDCCDSCQSQPVLCPIMVACQSCFSCTSATAATYLGTLTYVLHG